MSALLLNADEIDRLYSRVTAAIMFAERAEATGSNAQAAARYLEVSFLEEEISELLPASDREGEVARRGVITAAMSASQFVRAIEMAKKYEADSSASEQLKNQLALLRGDAEIRLRSVPRGTVLVHPQARFQLVA